MNWTDLLLAFMFVGCGIIITLLFTQFLDYVCR
jgi:hypothetical protein